MARTTETEVAEILIMYERSVPQVRISSELGISRDRVRRVIKKALADGTVKKTKIKPDTGKKGVQSQLRYAMICDLYRDGYLLTEIAKALSITATSVQQYVNKAMKRDDIPRAYSKERRNAVRRHQDKLGEGRTFKARGRTFVPSTLSPGETVRCNASVSAKCVYGSTSSSSGLCRFSECTWFCRSVGPEGCSYKACTRFSRISKDNPKLIAGGDFGDSIEG